MPQLSPGGDKVRGAGDSVEQRRIDRFAADHSAAATSAGSVAVGAACRNAETGVTSLILRQQQFHVLAHIPLRVGDGFGAAGCPRYLPDAGALAVAQADQIDAGLRDIGRNDRISRGVGDHDVLRPSGEDIAAQRQLGRAEDISGAEPAVIRRRRYRKPVDRQRQDGGDREIAECQPLPAGAVAHLVPIGRGDAAVQPFLNELTGRGYQSGQQRIVGIRKGGLAGLQPGFDLAECRQIAKRHHRARILGFGTERVSEP